MNAIMEYLIVIVAIFGFSAVASMTKQGFSTNIFLVSIIISINVLVWQNVLPFWTIIICIFLIVGILFTDDSGDGIE
jgi:hypothetical protein